MSVTVVLTTYRRYEILPMQLEALSRSTYEIKRVMIWNNGAVPVDFRRLGVDGVNASRNWGFFCRFALAQLADTEFVAIIDDDALPGPRWFEACAAHLASEDAILGSCGDIIDGERVGWDSWQAKCPASLNHKTTEVDHIGMSWFLRPSTLSVMFREQPATWGIAEGVHLSWMARKYLNVRSYVTGYPNEDRAAWATDPNYSQYWNCRSAASQDDPKKFEADMTAAIDHYIRSGWRTLLGSKR